MDLLNKFDMYMVEKKDESEMDKNMLKKGKYLKIILPKGKGEPLYTNSFSAAKEMAKEYGKGTKVVDLKKGMNEANLQYERDKQKKIANICDMAQDAFWNAVKREYKEAKTDNVDEYMVKDFNAMCIRMVEHYCSMNMPKPNMEQAVKTVGY